MVCLGQVTFLVNWVWPCNGYYRIREILWHKSILLQGKSGNMFKMWWHFYIYIKFTFSKNIEHIEEYISCFTMHVELFLQLKVHDIKWKLATPPVIRVISFWAPSILRLFLLNAPPSGFSAPPPPPPLLLIIIAQSLTDKSHAREKFGRGG